MIKSAGDLKKHVLNRLEQRFGITISTIEYFRMNALAKKSTVINSSHIKNCDYRELEFKSTKIVVIFDNNINRIKTVLKPIVKEVYRRGDIKRGIELSGEVIKSNDSGYIVILSDGSFASLHNSVNSLILKKGSIHQFKILSSMIDKKKDNIKNFVRIV